MRLFVPLRGTDDILVASLPLRLICNKVIWFYYFHKCLRVSRLDILRYKGLVPKGIEIKFYTNCSQIKINLN